MADNRPIDGWYIRIYPHPILSPPPRPSGVRESTQMLSNPTARTLRPIQFQSARNPKSPESLMFRMTLPTDVSARSGAPSSPTLPYSTSITIPPTPRSPRPNVDGAAPSSTLDLDVSEFVSPCTRAVLLNLVRPAPNINPHLNLHVKFRLGIFNAQTAIGVNFPLIASRSSGIRSRSIRIARCSTHPPASPPEGQCSVFAAAREVQFDEVRRSSVRGG